MLRIRDLALNGDGTEQNPWIGWDKVVNSKNKQDLKLQFEDGYYAVTEVIKVFPGWWVFGEGYKTIIHADVANPFSLLAPINARTDENVRFADFWINCRWGKGNFNAGINIIGASNVIIERIKTSNWQCGIIFDQAENCVIRDSALQAIANGCNIWLVCSDLHTPGAQGQYTNNITIDNVEHYGEVTSIGIVDDGGCRHTISKNDFAGLKNALTLACAWGVTFNDNYLESQSDSLIQLRNSSPFDPNNVVLNNTFSLNVLGNHFSSNHQKIIDVYSSVVGLNFVGNTCLGEPEVSFINHPEKIVDFTAHSNWTGSLKPLLEGGPITIKPWTMQTYPILNSGVTN